MGASRHCNNLFQPPRLGDRAHLRTCAAASSAFVDPAGNVLITDDDITAGKGGFQKADLMDYGSIYGMGSYFGEDYTASTLVRLGVLTKQSLVNSAATPPNTTAPLTNRSPLRVPPERRPNRPLPPPHRSPTARRPAATATMQKELQSIDLTQPKVVVPDAVAQAIRGAQAELATKLNTVNLSAGWVPAKVSTPCCASRPPISSSIPRSPLWRGGPTSEHFIDREPAVRAIGRQHADDQRLPMDVDQLLLHLFLDGVRAVALSRLPRPPR